MTDRHSLYWDDFQKRATETVDCLISGKEVPVRRVAIFVTNRCNFRCKYCNVKFCNQDLSEDKFSQILAKYGGEPIYHITGGEPSVVKWLYPFLEKHGGEYRFHLNTNAYIAPPASSVRRLKISLDYTDPEYWDDLVGRKGAFQTVTNNIKNAIPKTVVSITYTLNKSNYSQSVDFAKFAKEQFPGLYAVFYSVYKGTNPDFAWTADDADIFFSDVLPKLESELEPESLALIKETIDEKVRLIQGVRFPENNAGPCYLSMSERVFSPAGEEFRCSHLYRDRVFTNDTKKCEKCLYGCNRRLVQFNQEVEKELERKDHT